MKKAREDLAVQGKLERGFRLLAVAVVMVGGYKTAEGDADMQQVFALLTVTFAVASVDSLLIHFRGLKENN